MPIIIDANRAGDFSKPVSPHAAEILRRIAANRMRVSVGGKLWNELAQTCLKSFLIEWSRIGRLCRQHDNAVGLEEKTCSQLLIESDDPHVLALARVGGCQLLYTDDNNLIKDFKNIRLVSPKGKVVKSTTSDRFALPLFEKMGA